MKLEAIEALKSIGMPDGYEEILSGAPLFRSSPGDANPTFAIAAESAARAARFPEYNIEVPTTPGPQWTSRTLTEEEADAVKAAFDAADEPYRTEPLAS